MDLKLKVVSGYGKARLCGTCMNALGLPNEELKISYGEEILFNATC